MKHFFPKTFFALLCWLLGGGGSATAQTGVPQTADDYIRPYTESFQYGSNIGYYGTAWSDEALAALAQKAGVHTLRPTLPESFLEYHGYNARASTFDAYVNKLGMKELTCFIGNPVSAHRDFTTYPGCAEPSKLFSHLYEPIWNPDGTVNADNYYANYVYKLLLTYGTKVRFWEVVNEPDYAKGMDATPWLTRPPTPNEQINTKAPFYHYVRMLRITYEVVKKYYPESYVTTGLGYPEYLDALMRYTDNPDGGAATTDYPRTGGAYFDVVSFHAYPNYALHYWDSSINGFRYTRTSDYAANKVMEYRSQMADVLTKYGYDGTKHPGKILTITESNVSRRTSNDRISSDEAQRNFGIKSLVLAQKNDIKQYYYFQIGETVNAPDPSVSVSGADEIGLMGLYENLTRDAPGAAHLTQLGQTFKTISQLLYDYHYDAARTAALQLPAAIDGAAFSKDGQYIYVLWAKALVDTSEQASASYDFPTAWNIASVQRSEWDFSSTGTQETQPAQAIPLSGTPAFFTTTAAPAPPVCSATGSLLREQWNNINGSNIADIPLVQAPSSSGALTQFEAATSQEFNYGARLRGYICPPQSGAYVFSLAGDDATELWLSTDDQPANKARIATCSGWTSSIHDYMRYASQRSVAINLVAGQRYYIEALHKQGWGPGYVSVAWRLPDGSSEAPLAGSHLSPFAASATPPPPPTPSTCSATGSLLREQWSNVNGSTVAEIPLTQTPTSTAELTQFEAPTGLGSNYGARLSGYVCPPLSGPYTFYIAGDDQSELWLSTDDQPANKARIATCISWTSSIHDYMRYSSQRSVAINLVAGQRYYIEALHKQGWGPGYVSVAWRLPDGSMEGPIAGSRLSPFTSTSTVAARTLVAPAMSAGGLTAQLLAYPNPFSRQATVEFRLGTAGQATLAVYDVRGQLVRSLFQGASTAGAVQRINLEAEGLSQGIYVLRLVTDKQVLTQRLVFDK